MITRAAPAMSSTLSEPASAGSRPSVMQLVLRDQEAVHAAYMPALQSGGLFVPTTREYRLGDEAYLLVGLPDEPARHPVVGRVVWITPGQGSAGRPQGIGVAFPADEKAQALRLKIEALLGTSVSGSRPTHTL
jgi:type IV pilus assembly protein PilZ